MEQKIRPNPDESKKPKSPMARPSKPTTSYKNLAWLEWQDAFTFTAFMLTINDLVG